MARLRVYLAGRGNGPEEISEEIMSDPNVMKHINSQIQEARAAPGTARRGTAQPNCRKPKQTAGKKPIERRERQE